MVFGCSEICSNIKYILSALMETSCVNVDGI